MKGIWVPIAASFPAFALKRALEELRPCQVSAKRCNEFEIKPGASVRDSYVGIPY